jgi:hypothetical protein
VVPQGEAAFHDETGEERVVKQWEGISLSRGAYYWFKCTSEENLVLLRFGANDKDLPRGDSLIDIERGAAPVRFGGEQAHRRRADPWELLRRLAAEGSATPSRPDSFALRFTIGCGAGMRLVYQHVLSA